MSEYAYLRKFPMRIVLLHATAWVADRTLPVAALIAGFSDSDKTPASNSGDDRLTEERPVEDRGPKPETSGSLKSSAKLPPWFDRSNARHHVVGGLEDPIGRLHMMQWRIGAADGLFTPSAPPKPLPAKPVNLFKACQVLGASLSGRAKGQAKGW